MDTRYLLPAFAGTGFAGTSLAGMPKKRAGTIMKAAGPVISILNLVSI